MIGGDKVDSGFERRLPPGLHRGAGAEIVAVAPFALREKDKEAAGVEVERQVVDLEVASLGQAGRKPEIEGGEGKSQRDPNATCNGRPTSHVHPLTAVWRHRQLACN